MNLGEYSQYDGLGLAELVRSKQVSARELAETALRAIDAANPALNAIIEVYRDAPDNCRADSAASDVPFPGVPFLLKDIGSHDANVKFELGSRLTQGLRAPPFASELVNRFRTSGVTIVGRTNIPELGSSCTTEPLLYGPTRNPWNLERTPGGSSGGAAAAVASGIVSIAHANDAGGSIRWPASCCGLFGLKPSRNLNPLGPDAALAVNGLAAEHILSRSVRDTAAMLDMTAGPDPGAWCYTPRLDGSYLKQSAEPPKKLRIALDLIANFPKNAVMPDVIDSVRASARLCETLGHDVEEASVQFDFAIVLEAFSIIWSTGLRAAVDMLAPMMNRPIGPETLEPHLLAAFRDAGKISAARLQWALEQMNLVARGYGELFQRYDVALSPVGAQEPFALGRISAIKADSFHDWFLGMAAHCPFASAANIAGVPAMSVPLGWSRSGLPIGSQFVAAMGQELLLLKLARQLEAAQPWSGRRPAHHVAALKPSA
jgi:amidase